MDLNCKRAPGRTLAAGWLYAAGVVMFSQDIASLVLHLGGRWLDNPPIDPGEYPLGAMAFVLVALLAMCLIRSAAPTVEWDIMHERFHKPVPTRWIAFAAFMTSALAGMLDPVEPLAVVTGALFAVEGALDALLLRDLRLTVPYTKRSSVLLRAPVVAAAYCALAASAGDQSAAFLLRVVLVILAPSMEPLGFEVAGFEDVSTAEYWEEDDPNPHHASWVCLVLLAFVLAAFLLGPVDAQGVLPVAAIIGVIYLLSGDFSDALRVRAVLSLLICAGILHVADDSLATVSIACTVAVLVLMSLTPACATVGRLIAFLVMLMAACWLLGPYYRDTVLEALGAAWLIFAYAWQRCALWTRTGARHIRFHLD